MVTLLPGGGGERGGLGGSSVGMTPGVPLVGAGDRTGAVVPGRGVGGVADPLEGNVGLGAYVAGPG
jgi:hypothetical protein